MRKKTLTFLLIGTSFLLLAFLIPNISEAQISPSVSLSADPVSVPSGGSTNLTWWTNAIDVCVASGGWSGYKSLPSGSKSINIDSDTTFTLTCYNGRTSGSDSVTVTVSPPSDPTVNFWASSYTVNYGESTTLSWDSTYATVCYHTMGTSVWRNGGGPQPVSGSGSTGSLTSNTTFGINCYNNETPPREAADTITINVIGECSPGTPDFQDCGSAGTPCFGTQTKICKANYTWPSTWSACPTNGNPCGNCGTCSRGACTGEGECSAGPPPETQICDRCGTQTCQSDCNWGSSCTGEGECSPGVDSPDCPCPSDECIGFDYYDYSGNNGDCLSVCDCDTGTASGQPCELSVSYYDARCPFGFEDPLKTGKFKTIINTLIDSIFKVALVLAPLIIIIAGFLFATAGDNLERAAKAKRIIIWTIIALIVILIAKGIWSLVQQILEGF